MGSWKWVASARKGSRNLAKGLWRLLKGSKPRHDAGGRCLIAADEAEHLARQRMAHLTPIQEPLLLISQAPRSGGTILSQLFDGHPQCHAHPGELDIGHPDKTTWPRLSVPGSASEWWKILFETDSLQFFLKGYKKSGLHGGEARLPFLLAPSLQQSIFEGLVHSHPIANPRDVLNCYWTSYFYAWLDNQNLLGFRKKWVTAFVPRLMLCENSVAGFCRDYPDGCLVSVLRDPRSWYSSARRWSPAEFDALDTAMDYWLANAQAMLRNRSRFGERVILLVFEDLLQDTAGTMRRLAELLGIEEHPTLLTPTFNNQPIKANSSYAVTSAGVLRDPASRYENDLNRAELAEIERKALPVYHEVTAVCLRPGRFATRKSA